MLQTLRDIVLFMAGITVIIAAVIVTYQAIAIRRAVQLWSSRLDKLYEKVAQVDKVAKGVVDVAELITDVSTGIPSKVRAAIPGIRFVAGILPFLREKKKPNT